jgi:hypothetical protein
MFGNVVTLPLGLWPRQGGCKVAGQEGGPGVASHVPKSAKSAKNVGNEPSNSQVNSHCGSWSPNGFPNF